MCIKEHLEPSYFRRRVISNTSFKGVRAVWANCNSAFRQCRLAAILNDRNHLPQGKNILFDEYRFLMNCATEHLIHARRLVN
jgi:hypothetical protein